MRSRAFTLPFLAIFLRLGLVLSICRRSSQKLAGPGSLGRRLAGIEDNKSVLSSLELDLLCAAAQEWAPAERFFEEPRGSPQLVEAFF